VAGQAWGGRTARLVIGSSHRQMLAVAENTARKQRSSVRVRVAIRIIIAGNHTGNGMADLLWRNTITGTFSRCASSRTAMKKATAALIMLAWSADYQATRSTLRASRLWLRHDEGLAADRVE
jgi:hypothetical protein